MLSYEEEDQLKACLKANPADLSSTTVAWLIQALNETHIELVTLYELLDVDLKETSLVEKALRVLIETKGMTRRQACQKLRSIKSSKQVSRIKAAKIVLVEAEKWMI